MDLPILVADGKQLVFPVVEELMPRRSVAVAGQIGKLVVAVEMNAEVLCAGLLSL
jgi:hypothetical protein